MFGGGLPLFVSGGISAQNQGPERSIGLGSLLSESFAHTVRRRGFHLSGIDSSPLAAVGIPGASHFGNRDYGNAHGAPFCSNFWNLLKGIQQWLLLLIKTNEFGV